MMRCGKIHFQSIFTALTFTALSLQFGVRLFSVNIPKFWLCRKTIISKKKKKPTTCSVFTTYNSVNFDISPLRYKFTMFLLYFFFLVAHRRHSCSSIAIYTVLYYYFIFGHFRPFLGHLFKNLYPKIILCKFQPFFKHFTKNLLKKSLSWENMANFRKSMPKINILAVLAIFGSTIFFNLFFLLFFTIF